MTLLLFRGKADDEARPNVLFIAVDDLNDWIKPLLGSSPRPMENSGNHAVRTERWRCIRYVDGGEERYDHSRDPLEWHNLAAQPRSVAVKRETAAWLSAVNAPGAAKRAN